VEPEPENFGWLEKSLRLNGFTNVLALQLAVSDEAGGFAQLHLSEFSGWHSLTSRAAHGNTIPVAIQSLDGLVAADEIPPPTAVKIDVEGWELRVLEGGDELFHTAENLLVFIDIHPHLGVDPREIAEFLRKRGFRLAPTGDLDAELDVDSGTLELVGLKGERTESRVHG
jgi:FkbM family methyltransferase